MEVVRKNGAHSPEKEGLGTIYMGGQVRGWGVHPTCFVKRPRYHFSFLSLRSIPSATLLASVPCPTLLAYRTLTSSLPR